MRQIGGGYDQDVVRGYEPTDVLDPWKRYDPSGPAYANDLVALQPGRGYWIKVTQDCEWSLAN